MLRRLWRRLGVATTLDAADAAARVARRLERHDKRTGRINEVLDRHEQRAAQLVESLAELRASVARLEEAVTHAGEQARVLTLARRDDRTAFAEAPQLSAALERETDAIDAHLGRAMAGASLSCDPFPHMVIDQLLPQPFYNRILAALPPNEYWRSSGIARDYWEIESDVGPWQTEAIWRFVDRRVVDGMLRPRLLDAFRPHLAAFWRDGFGLDPACVQYHTAEGRLQRRRKGYRLRPHLDPPHAALTGLFYLAQPSDDPTYGTSLYRPATPLPIKRQGIFYPEDHGIAVERAVTVPLRANTLLVWMTSLGPHGADLTGAEVPKSLERHTYQFQCVTDNETRRRLKAK